MGRWLTWKLSQAAAPIAAGLCAREKRLVQIGRNDVLAVHLVHAPHVAGLSRRGRMWVYVSAGTGTWGPPVRFGTEPELTLLRVVRRDSATQRIESAANAEPPKAIP